LDISSGHLEDAVPKSTFTDAYREMLSLLLAARRAAGVTQVELSKRLGKQQSFVSNVERGLRRIDVIEFYAIATALGLDPQRLFAELASKLPRKVGI
jgi:transcriptional regulator with XRE-family HTH domain